VSVPRVLDSGGSVGARRRSPACAQMSPICRIALKPPKPPVDQSDMYEQTSESSACVALLAASFLPVISKISSSTVLNAVAA
jgi:hypothetical protein